MKPWLILAIVALLLFAWMFRYDVHTTAPGDGYQRLTLKYDRWTGEVYVFLSADVTWVPYGRGLPQKPPAVDLLEKPLEK